MSTYNSTYDYEYCDGDALPAESTTISSLAPNQLHKVCPGLHRDSNGSLAPLGQPRCGDGSNYAFFVSRPAERHQQDQKIVIELSGGGACWDALTCKLQSFMLSFPPFFDLFLGSNCSDPLICGKAMGDADFSTYTSVLIPYCTQDVHMGDEPNATYDGGDSVVRHVGAHNVHRTLRWVFENFPDPSQIFVTGCSAGGTPLPVVYALINRHYGERDVDIDVIMDSPVYLTPSHFLRNYFPNWNVGTLLNEIGFDFDAHMNDTRFPDLVLDYALRTSKKTDNFGFVTHDNDQRSIFYYEAMSGNLLGGRGRELSSSDSSSPEFDASAISNSGRRMDADAQSEWWAQINNSMTLAMEDHNNMDIFVMEGDGHCSFSLNVPLEYEGFEEWASAIVNEKSAVDQNQTETTNNAAVMQASSTFAITAMMMLTMRFLSSRMH